MNNYIVIGAGGTGSHLIPALYTWLANYHKTDDWSLWVVDGDVVEAKNLDRQMFTQTLITMNKAEAIVSRLGPNAHAKPDYLGEENIESVVREGDTVFICADNYTVRKRIAQHALKLDTIVIINGGNELNDGSVQIYAKAGGVEFTPRITYLHPEIEIGEGVDRAEMTCVAAAALPGGEQLLVVNMLVASYMLTALHRVKQGLYDKIVTPDEAGPSTWTELQFHIGTTTEKPVVDYTDWRVSETWSKYD